MNEKLYKFYLKVHLAGDFELHEGEWWIGTGKYTNELIALGECRSSFERGKIPEFQKALTDYLAIKETPLYNVMKEEEKGEENV